MVENFVKSKAGFSLHLDGNNEIDAVLLSKIIRDIASLTKMAANSENPEAYLKMNVTAFKDGSFEIDFSAICETAMTTAQTVVPMLASYFDLAHKAVNILKAYFEIKKHLKGAAPKEVHEKGDVVEVTNIDGRIIQAPKASANIMYNSYIDNLVINISGYATEHDPKGGFSISDEKDHHHYTVDDIKQMTKLLPMEEIISCQKTRKETILYIRKPDILGNSRWGFKYENKNIEANIEDEDFLDSVHNGLSVAAGDYVQARLEICVDLDPDGEPIKGSEKYTVYKVCGSIQHSSEEEQLLLQ